MVDITIAIVVIVGVVLYRALWVRAENIVREMYDLTKRENHTPSVRDCRDIIYISTRKGKYRSIFDRLAMKLVHGSPKNNIWKIKPRNVVLEMSSRQSDYIAAACTVMAIQNL